MLFSNTSGTKEYKNNKFSKLKFILVKIVYA